jgi:hypothetical protein
MPIYIVLPKAFLKQQKHEVLYRQQHLTGFIASLQDSIYASISFLRSAILYLSYSIITGIVLIAGIIGLLFEPIKSWQSNSVLSKSLSPK